MRKPEMLPWFTKTSSLHMWTTYIPPWLHQHYAKNSPYYVWMKNGDQVACEDFLNTWSTKILDLENIEDTTLGDDVKRIWLNKTLQSHPAMRDAVQQSQTTELTLQGMSHTNIIATWASY